MEHLSNEAQVYKDIEGKAHDTQEKAADSSAQILLNRANAGGNLSVKALVNTIATNPDLHAYLTEHITARKTEITNEAKEQAGEAGVKLK